MDKNIHITHVLKHHDVKTTSLPKGSAIYIHGPPKSGKTQMVHEIVIQALQARIKNIKFPRLFDKEKEYTKQFEQYIHFMQEPFFPERLKDKVIVIDINDIDQKEKMTPPHLINNLEMLKTSGSILIFTSTTPPRLANVLLPYLTHHIKLDEVLE